MAEHEGRLAMRLRQDSHLPGGGRIAGVRVMIAADDRDLKVRMRIAEGQECGVECRDEQRRSVRPVERALGRSSTRSPPSIAATLPSACGTKAHRRC